MQKPIWKVSWLISWFGQFWAKGEESGTQIHGCSEQQTKRRVQPKLIPTDNTKDQDWRPLCMCMCTNMYLYLSMSMSMSVSMFWYMYIFLFMCLCWYVLFFCVCVCVGVCVLCRRKWLQIGRVADWIFSTEKSVIFVIWYGPKFSNLFKNVLEKIPRWTFSWNYRFFRVGRCLKELHRHEYRHANTQWLFIKLCRLMDKHNVSADHIVNIDETSCRLLPVHQIGSGRRGAKQAMLRGNTKEAPATRTWHGRLVGVACASTTPATMSSRGTSSWSPLQKTLRRRGRRAHARRPARTWDHRHAAGPGVYTPNVQLWAVHRTAPNVRRWTTLSLSKKTLTCPFSCLSCPAFETVNQKVCIFWEGGVIAPNGADTRWFLPSALHDVWLRLLMF